MKLESSIKELHEMFMDMAVLVEQQGEVVNRCSSSLFNSDSHHQSDNIQTKLPWCILPVVCFQKTAFFSLVVNSRGVLFGKHLDENNVFHLGREGWHAF